MAPRLMSPTTVVGKVSFCLLYLWTISLIGFQLIISRDKTAPVGYKVVALDFKDGSPVAAADSMTAAQDIFANKDNSVCPGSCFRPVGLALDAAGRLWVASDSSGELYVLAKTGASTASPTGTSPAPAATSTKASAGSKLATPVVLLVTVLLGAVMM